MHGWRTLREIDQDAARPKGAAFRAFRALESQLADGTDFRVLVAGAEYDALKKSGRAYASSVKVILLAPALAERLLQALR